jgi:hypothetical protein
MRSVAALEEGEISLSLTKSAACLSIISDYSSNLGGTVRDQAKDLDLPDYDFWLMDSTRVGILRFSDDDALLGAEIHDDPVLVVRHCYYRDVAWHYAIPYAEYAGS